MLTETQTQHFRDYGYTTAPALFDATEIRAMRAGLERFKREGLGRNVVTAGVAWGGRLTQRHMTACLPGTNRRLLL